MKLTAQKTPGQQLEQIAIMESPQWLNGWGGGILTGSIAFQLILNTAVAHKGLRPPQIKLISRMKSTKRMQKEKNPKGHAKTNGGE